MTSRWGFCMLSYMPRVHQVAYSSILSPFRWPSFAKCSWSACWSFLLAHWSVGGMELQSYAAPQAPPRISRRFDQWNGTLRHLSPFLESRNVGRWSHETSCGHAWHRQLCKVMLQPKWTRSRQRPRCTHNPLTLGMVPWSQCPKHQTVRLEDRSWGASHHEKWCHLAFGTFCTSWWSLGCPHTLMASRNHFAIFSPGCEIYHSGLHMVRSSTSQWFGSLRLLVHIFWAGRLSTPCTGMDHPIGGVYSHTTTVSSYFPPVARILKPWSSQCLRTMGRNLSPLAACHRVENRWWENPAC